VNYLHHDQRDEWNGEVNRSDADQKSAWVTKLLENCAETRAQSNVQHREYDEIRYGEVREGLHVPVLLKVKLTLTASSRT
jgi:hypothetical protein